MQVIMNEMKEERKLFFIQILLIVFNINQHQKTSSTIILISQLQNITLFVQLTGQIVEFILNYWKDNKLIVL